MAHTPAQPQPELSGPQIQSSQTSAAPLQLSSSPSDPNTTLPLKPQWLPLQSRPSQPIPSGPNSSLTRTSPVRPATTLQPSPPQEQWPMLQHLCAQPKRATSRPAAAAGLQRSTAQVQPQ